ncbi:MAG: winged helix-turn-helix domain-containing protein [Thermoplasmataceae archaeon]
MVNPQIMERIVSALRDGPLYVKEIAKKASISQNTAGKYVEILVQTGKAKSEKYAGTKQISLVNQRNQE